MEVRSRGGARIESFVERGFKALALKGASRASALPIGFFLLVVVGMSLFEEKMIKGVVIVVVARLN